MDRHASSDGVADWWVTEMQDPDPENIAGRKVQKHSFEHSIRWDYVLLAVAAIYVTWKVSSRLSSSSEDGDDLDDLEDGAEIRVAEGGGLA